MIRPCFQKPCLLLLSVGVALLGVDCKAVTPSPSVVATTTCPGQDGQEVTVRLVQRVKEEYESARRIETPRVWERSIFLESRGGAGRDEWAQIWSSKEDVAAGYMGPEPRIVGDLACRSKSRATGLDIFLLLIKRPFYEEGLGSYKQEAWFHHFRSFDDGASAYVIWSYRDDSIPHGSSFGSKLQARLSVESRGVLADFQDGLGGEGERRFFFYFDLERRAITTFLPEVPRSGMVEKSVPEQSILRGFDPYGSNSEVLSCDSLEDCTTARDPCGTLRGVRREFYGDYVVWARQTSWSCALFTYDADTCVESLACEDGRCEVWWRPSERCRPR